MDAGYHHGALRETLLTEARRLLVEDGLEAVTLRELARRAGVSHAAPARHFADRDALLDALRDRGFDELTAALEHAADSGALGDRLTAYGRAHALFALDNGPLVALMFGRKAPAGDAAAARFFALGARLLGEAPTGAPGPLPYLVAATFEGIASLVAAGRLPRDRLDEVVAAAVRTLLPAVRAQQQDAAAS